MQAKKSFGQHFLHNNGILEKICRLVEAQGIQNILEIGPGKAALTQHLLKLDRRLLAIEADQDMQNFLLQHHILTADQLICGDVLKQDFTKIFGGEAFLLCGNFPYNISSQIVFQTLQHTDRIPAMIGMFQKEVAMRIVSNCGTKDYGILSVLTQLMYNTKKCFDVPPEAFTPAPKVMSSVVELKRREDFLDVRTFDRVRKLVKNAFQYRRKTLRNNLKNVVQDPLILSDPYFDQRAEQLSPSQFLELSRRLWPS